jgi:signal transduction histidine kinase
MSLLQNPVIVSMVALLLLALALFVGAVLVIRHMRREIQSEADLGTPRESRESNFAMAAYQGVIQRLKEQEQELERLRKAEKQRATATENISEAVLSNLSSGVLLFDNTLIIRQVNAAAKEIFGYASPFSLHARDLFKGVTAVRRETGEPEASEAALVAAVEAAVREGVAFRRLEADYSTPAGVRRVLGVTLSPVRGSGGEPLGAACLVSDLTQMSELAREVRLRENMAALGEMSAGIAHEFKNSLATISGYAQMLKTERDAVAAHGFAEKIVAETAGLTRIVTDFLNFARPQTLHREPVALAAVLADCAAECGVELEAAGVSDGIELQGDRTALRQTFANLMRNSAEASRPGARVRVKAEAQVENGVVHLRLQDDGAGIRSADLPKVFIPFFTTKPHGTGLGLALVHRIVSEHGGTVAVASDPSGTAFTLSFPVQNAAGNATESG